MRSLLTVLFVLAFVHPPLLHGADDTEDELQRFSDTLSKEVKESGRKKVAIVDFTDLQNKPVEIGRYLSEQITVNLVSSKGGFKVVDRANLNSILAEHKLTTSGLVEPDNVRKFGSVSGIDALILGTVTVLGDSIQLTAKVIATDTAIVEAAAKGKLRKTSELEKLLEKPPVTERSTANQAKPAPVSEPAVAPAAQLSPSKAPVETANTQVIEPLEVAVKSFSVRSERNASSGTVIFNVTNTGKEAVALAFPKAVYQSCSILNKKGESIEYNEGTGIMVGPSLRAFATSDPTVVAPGKSVRSVFKFHNALDPTTARFSPFQFQLSLDVAETEGGRFSNVRTLDFVIDLKQ
jgi:TolB-like protein